MVVIFLVENCKILILDENFPAGAIPGVGPFLTPKTPKRGSRTPGAPRQGEPVRADLGPQGAQKVVLGGLSQGGPPPAGDGGFGALNPPKWPLIPLEPGRTGKFIAEKSQFPHKTPQLNCATLGYPLGCTKNGHFWGSGTPLGGPPGDPPGTCLLYTSPSPRDLSTSRMPSSA